MLEQQDCGDERGRRSDGFEEADATLLFGHSTAHEHDDARHRKQSEEPAADCQGLPLGRDELCVLLEDLV